MVSRPAHNCPGTSADRAATTGSRPVSSHGPVTWTAAFGAALGLGQALSVQSPMLLSRVGVATFGVAGLAPCHGQRGWPDTSAQRQRWTETALDVG